MDAMTCVTATQYKEIILPAIEAGRNCGMVVLRDGYEVLHAFLAVWDEPADIEEAIREYMAEYAECYGDSFDEFVDNFVEEYEILVAFWE